jgi:hypothetical protein
METKDGFVLDCSITMTWCFDDEATPYSAFQKSAQPGQPTVSTNPKRVFGFGEV